MLAKIQIPPFVKKGTIFQIRLLIQHPMETGFRFGLNGTAIPKNVIPKLAGYYAGREIIQAELNTGIAANPLLVFPTRAVESGDIVFEWNDEAGQSGRQVARLVVVD